MPRRPHLRLVHSIRRKRRGGTGGGGRPPSGGGGRPPSGGGGRPPRRRPPSDAPAQGNPFGVFVAALCFVGVAWIGFDDALISLSGWLKGIVIGGGLFCSVVCFVGLALMCPSCKRSWAEEEVGEECLDRWVDSVTQTFTSEHFDDRGNKTGESQVERPVTVTMERIRTYYRCQYCDHRWDKLSQRAK